MTKYDVRDTASGYRYFIDDREVTQQEFHAAVVHDRSAPDVFVVEQGEPPARRRRTKLLIAQIIASAVAIVAIVVSFIR